MEIEQVAELARAVAALPQDQKDFFEGMVADERAAAAEAKRIAKLRAMSDEDAVQFAIKQASDVFAFGELPERLLTALREVGFVRLTDSDEGAVELAYRLMRNSPRVRMLMAFEAGHALCDELAKDVPAPTWSTGA